MSTQKLKINLFGESFKIKRLVIPDELLVSLEGIAAKMKQPLHEVLYDPYFYYFLKNKKIQTIDDLPGNSIEGLLGSPKNQIEIWQNRKKVRKLKINDLNNDLLLFPLYNTAKTKLNFKDEKGIYFERKEIGQVASYNLSIDNFNIDDLQFKLLEINEFNVLEKVTYKNKELVSKKKDTLITFQNSFEVK